MTHGDAACVTSKSLKPKDSDASDARDAKNPPDSGCPIPEQQIHRAVVQHLRARGMPGLVFIHVPNGGYRRPSEAAIFSGLGVRAGVSDLLLWHGGKSFALELKADGGRVTKGQREFLSDMEGAGAYTCLAEGLDDAIEMLEAWGLLRSKMQ